MAANTPTSEIQNALNAALDLTTLVHQTVNGLIGIVPEPGSGKGGAEVSPDGVLPRMASTSRYVVDQVSSAAAALRRLQDATDQAVNVTDSKSCGYIR